MLKTSILKSAFGYRRIRGAASLFVTKGAFLYLLFSFAFPGMGLNPLFGQRAASDYQITQFTTNEGLNSNICHEVVVDSKGFLWIASEGGLMRFDGRNFRVFGEGEGLENQTIIHLVKTNNDQLWMHTVEGDVWVLRPNSDRVELFHGNDTIKKLFQGSLGFSRDHFYVSDSRELYLDLIGKDKVLLMDSGMNVKYLSSTHTPPGTEIINLPDGEFYPISFYKNDNGYIANFIDKGSEKGVSGGRVHRVWYGDLAFNVFYDPATESVSGNYVFPIGGDTLIHYCCGNLTIFTPKKVIGQAKSSRVLDIKRAGDGSLLVAYHYKKGLRRFVDINALMNDEFEVLLSNHSVTSISLDRDGNFWLATLESGIFHFKSISVHSFIRKEGITNLESDRKSLLFYCDKSNVYGINRYTKEELNLDLAFNEIRNIEFSTILNKLFISSNYAKYFDPEEGGKVRPFRDQRRYMLKDSTGFISKQIPVDAKRIKVFSRDSILLISSAHWMLYGSLDSFSRYNSAIQGSREFLRFNDVTYYEGKLVFASDSGLVKLDSGRYYKFQPNPLLSRNRISEVDIFDDNLVATNHNKAVYIISPDSSLIVLELLRDFPGKHINRVFFDQPGLLYICTDQGLVIAEHKEGEFTLKIHVSEADGLSSKIVRDVCRIGDTVYIATSKGIDFFLLHEIKNLRRKIFIESVNDTYIHGSPSGSIDIPADDDVLIKFTAIQPVRDVHTVFRHRINGGEWIYSEEYEVRLSSLSPGKYEFEVCSQNNHGIWDDCEVLSLKKLARWYDTTWFRILSILFGFGLVIYYFLWRIRLERRKRRTERQIMDLERKALNAQMNPHFIFNILNSIQSYIYFNDNKSAMKYLARFARLIRQSLVASTEASITLEQDMSMIQNYLELEELRHKDRFTFSVKYNGARDSSTIRIPPMIIQPFVENAVFHGLKGIESGAVIDVLYILQDEYVEVMIRDNGCGMASDALDKEDSLGIKLTRQRLELLNKPGVPIMDIISAPGQGTEVRVFISMAEVQDNKRLVRWPRSE